MNEQEYNLAKEHEKKLRTMASGNSPGPFGELHTFDKIAQRLGMRPTCMSCDGDKIALCNFIITKMEEYGRE